MGKNLKHYSDYLNERKRDYDREPLEDDELAPFTTSDGWDEDQLADVGLIDLFADIQKVIYEVKNARRGSYAKFGDTGADLGNHLVDLAQTLEATGEDILSTADQYRSFLKRKRR